MPLISVVVPIYNVEAYLDECLDSLAQQTHRDVEVVMVDDGSTDASAAVATAFAERDARFRLVQQRNGGLGNARNTGADHATGDYIAFVDSDDVVVAHAYESLVGSLEETGSDFASGNYHRLTTSGRWQSAMVASTFTANRPRTHITRHPALLNDRTAWNKLFRRSFWEEHRFRWPEGVLYEDIPVTLPAHVLARSVDVLRDPVYLWRARAGDSSSITQRRTEPRAIRDRTAAVDGVSRFLARRGETALKKQYDRSVAEQDLRYFLNALDVADGEFRALFLDLVNDYFDRAADDVFEALPAIHRLQWHLVRRRLMSELVEVLRFEKSGEIEWTPVIRKGRRLWGDYPFRGDPDLALPDHLFRLDREELPLRALVEDVAWDGPDLVVRGYAHISFLDIEKRGAARIRLTLEETGHRERVVPMDVALTRRPDVTEAAPDGVTNYDWCGFTARAPIDALRHRGRFRDGHWQLRVEVKAHGITRRRWMRKTDHGPARRPPAVAVDGALVVPTSQSGDFSVEVRATVAELTGRRLDGRVLELHGFVRGRALDPAGMQLRLARADGGVVESFPAATGGPPGPHGQPFVARLPLDEVPGPTPVLTDWEVALVTDPSGARLPLTSATDRSTDRLDVTGGEVVVGADRQAFLRVGRGAHRPVVEDLRWSDDRLVLTGSYHEPTGAPTEIVLRDRERGHTVTVPMVRDGTAWSADVRPEAAPSPAGPMPLAEGQWDLLARPVRKDLRSPLARTVPARLARDLFSSLPRTHEGVNREFTVVDDDFDGISVLSGRDLPPAVSSRSGRTRLQRMEFPAFLASGPIDVLLVDAYPSGEYGGDARAIVEELRRREHAVRIVWSVLDGQAILPTDVEGVIRYSREWYETLARARLHVTGDVAGLAALPKPAHQRALQTWHGVPVGGVGLDAPEAGARFGRGWQDRIRKESARWDVLLSPGPAGTEVLRRGLGYEGMVLESGLPRHDRLVGSDRTPAMPDLRAELGVPESATVLLYAPTYHAERTHRRSLRNGLDRYRFDSDLDLPAAADELGSDHVLLVRPHPKTVDAVPEADGVSVHDVSRWPDVRDLLVAADVLVTDTSSVLVDFALLARPLVVWDESPHERRCGHVTHPVEECPALRSATVPARHVSSAADVVGVAVAAAADDGDAAAHRDFVDVWVPSADGKAAARAVDALLAD